MESVYGGTEDGSKENRALRNPSRGSGEVVRTLERGDAPLADSLKLFEEGAALITACTKELDEAEQKVVKLRKGPDGEPEELPFEEGAE